MTGYGARLSELADQLGDEVAVTSVAVDGTERTVTWRQLDERANQMARAMVERGVSVGDILLAELPNSPELLYALFGGWKLGATVVPTRWDLPE